MIWGSTFIITPRWRVSLSTVPRFSHSSIRIHAVKRAFRSGSRSRITITRMAKLIEEEGKGSRWVLKVVQKKTRKHLSYQGSWRSILFRGSNRSVSLANRTRCRRMSAYSRAESLGFMNVFYCLILEHHRQQWRTPCTVVNSFTFLWIKKTRITGHCCLKSFVFVLVIDCNFWNSNCCITVHVRIQPIYDL